MILLESQGRLGNVLLQNTGISLLAKKFNYKVYAYPRFEETHEVGIIMYSGSIENYNFKNYDDSNLMELMSCETLDHGIKYTGYFQNLNFLETYKNDLKSLIQPRNVLDIDKKNVFIHVRLDDAVFANPGIEYYEKALSQINFNEIYISSDSPESSLVQTLIDKYKMKLYNHNPATTITFAKNFNNLILSNGTFSWWIAFLSKAENIFYPELKNSGRMFHPDIYFSDWKCIKNDSN